MADVRFKEGSYDEYNAVAPGENNFYKVENNNSGDEDEDAYDVYLGNVQLNNGRLMNSIIAQIEDLDQRIYDLENPPTLIGNYTAAQVWDIVNAGEAENYWSVGDVTNPIELNGTVGICEFDHESYRATIIGFNHNADLETDGKYSMTLQFGQNDDGINTAFIDSSFGSTGSTNAFRMNTSDINSGGWESSYMRNTICPEFLKVLPSNLQNIVGITTKYTDNVGGGNGDIESNVTTTEDKVFLLSYNETGLTSSYPNSYETALVEPYSDMYSSDSDRIRYRHSAPSSTSTWWLRSPSRTSSISFCLVNAIGTSSTNIASTSYGFAPCFTIIGDSPVDVETVYDYATVLLDITINATTSTFYSNDFNIFLTDSSGNVLNISSVGKIDGEDNLIFTAGISNTFTLIGSNEETLEYTIEIPLVTTDLYCIVTPLTTDADSFLIYENGELIARPADKTESYSTSPLSLATNENEIEVVYSYRSFSPI